MSVCPFNVDDDLIRGAETVIIYVVEPLAVKDTFVAIRLPVSMSVVFTVTLKVLIALPIYIRPLPQVGARVVPEEVSN